MCHKSTSGQHCMLPQLPLSTRYSYEAAGPYYQVCSQSLHHASLSCPSSVQSTNNTCLCVQYLNPCETNTCLVPQIEYPTGLVFAAANKMNCKSLSMRPFLTVVFVDGQDVGKMQVAAIMGVQALRAKTKPRPFLRLQPQRIAVQVNPEDQHCS